MNDLSPAEKFAPPVPAAVKAGAARSRELQEKYVKDLQAPDGDPPAEPPVQPPAQEGETPAQPPVLENQPPVPPQPPVDENDGSWKHKFESMQGRYKADTTKLKQQVAELSSQITNLNNLLSTAARPAPSQPATPPAPQSSIKKEELDEYGPEFFDMVNRVVKDATQGYVQEIDTLKAQLKSVGGQVVGVGKAAVLAKLDENIENWRVINESDEFLAWLRLPDVYSGVIRHEMLKQAFERNDYPRVAAFFKGFLAELAATDPASDDPPISPPGKPPAEDPLKSLAAPGRAKSTAAPSNAPAEKPWFTTSQITQFYTDRGLGKWRGREKEANAIERDIFEAQREGRIR